MKYIGMIIDQSALMFPNDYSDKKTSEIINSFNFGLVFESFAEKCKNLRSWPGGNHISNECDLTVIGNDHNQKYFAKIGKK